MSVPTPPASPEENRDTGTESNRLEFSLDDLLPFSTQWVTSCWNTSDGEPQLTGCAVISYLFLKKTTMTSPYPFVDIYSVFITRWPESTFLRFWLLFSIWHLEKLSFSIWRSSLLPSCEVSVSWLAAYIDSQFRCSSHITAGKGSSPSGRLL